MLKSILAAAIAAAIGCASARACDSSFSGLASFYDRSSGLQTASGERFNDRVMTAAHRCLPFGTRLRVCRGDRCIIVRINDRGPFVKGRVLDLAQGAAEALGMTDIGVAAVSVTINHEGSKP